MKMKRIATATLIASVALSPISPVPQPVRADSGDVVAGLIIGGIIGSAVAKDNKKKKKTTASSSSSSSSAARVANKEVQTALNYFGYNVGTPDGSIGPKSRAAISEYQAFLGYPATGELTENERLILVTAYQRAVAGGATVADTVSSSPFGLKALLVAQRDEMSGVAPSTSLAGSTVAPAEGSVAAAAAAALPRLIPETAAEEEPVDVTEAEVTEAAMTEEAPALPSFMGDAGAKGSLASECDSISLATAGNGGMATADTMQDASFALGEQFCLARGAAIDASTALTAKLASFTPEQIAEQCAAFGPVLKEHVAALSLKPAAEVLEGVEGFVLTSGMSPAQLSGTAKVCLGTGYAQDDMNVAIGSALLLTALGERAYSEYLGHHLSQGYGATERPDLAMDWYQIAIDAMDRGQMVVAPEVSGRDLLIQKASYAINGRTDAVAPVVETEEAAVVVTEPAPAEAVVEVAAEPAVEPAPEPVVEPEVTVIATESSQEGSDASDADVATPVVATAEADEALAEEAATEILVAETEAQSPSVVPVVAESDPVTEQIAILAVRLPLMILTPY